jgi:hypothetical protein
MNGLVEDQYNEEPDEFVEYIEDLLQRHRQLSLHLQKSHEKRFALFMYHTDFSDIMLW